jgi:hypothetical protein
LQGFHLRHRKAGMGDGNGDIGDPGGLRGGRDLGAWSLVVGLVLRTVVDDQRHAQALAVATSATVICGLARNWLSIWRNWDMARPCCGKDGVKGGQPDDQARSAAGRRC